MSEAIILDLHYVTLYNAASVVFPILSVILLIIVLQRARDCLYDNQIGDFSLILIPISAVIFTMMSDTVIVATLHAINNDTQDLTKLAVVFLKIKTSVLTWGNGLTNWYLKKLFAFGKYTCQALLPLIVGILIQLFYMLCYLPLRITCWEIGWVKGRFSKIINPFREDESDQFPLINLFTDEERSTALFVLVLFDYCIGYAYSVFQTLTKGDQSQSEVFATWGLNFFTQMLSGLFWFSSTALAKFKSFRHALGRESKDHGFAWYTMLWILSIRSTYQYFIERIEMNSETGEFISTKVPKIIISLNFIIALYVVIEKIAAYGSRVTIGINSYGSSQKSDVYYYDDKEEAFIELKKSIGKKKYGFIEKINKLDRDTLAVLIYVGNDNTTCRIHLRKQLRLLVEPNRSTRESVYFNCLGTYHYSIEKLGTEKFQKRASDNGLNTDRKLYHLTQLEKGVYLILIERRIYNRDIKKEPVYLHTRLFTAKRIML